MKYKFEASNSLYDIHVEECKISVNCFVSLLASTIFAQKTQTCTFTVINYEPTQILNCAVDVPVVKRIFLNMFEGNKKKRKVVKKKKRRKRKRWISKSPTRRKRRRWISPQGRK